MLRSDATKNDFLYECYSKVEDDNEKKWAKKDFYKFISTKIIFLFYLIQNQQVI